jgi:hypothetical protein
MVFINRFVVFLRRKSKIKFLIASMTSLTNCEISSNPIQEARSSSPIATCNHKKLFRKSPVILTIVPKAGHECFLEQFTKERERKPEQKFDAAVGTIFRLVSVFKEASRNFIFIIL